MYIRDGICYAGDPDVVEKRIVEARPLAGRMLLVEFQSGERRLFDATRLTGAAFEPLGDVAVFSDVKLFHGIPTWAGGEIDVAPEYVYDNSVPYEGSDILFLAG